jgi:glycine/D-amino acid oxidase-like deaminating enzyme/nitrite reductase/ring-hydroxylating ferredoxin subunit
MDKEKTESIDILKINPQSFWLASTEKTNYPSLKEDIDVDVAIIGGGMAGIMTAFLIKEEGLSVAVLEGDGILQGTTGHTTAKVTSQHSLIYDEIKRDMGEEKAKIYADANETAVEFIKNLVNGRKIDCDFEEQSAYVYTMEDKYIKQIQDEAKTAADLGIKAHYLEDIPLPFDVKAALRFDNQGQFHPRKFLLNLAEDIPGGESNIFENTRVVGMQEGDPVIIYTEKGAKVKASKVLVASHYPFYDKPGLYFSRIYPERSYVLGITINDKYPGGMYITAEDPGRSLRSQRYQDDQLILVGGEHHKTGHGKSTINHYENLRDFANGVFSVKEFLYRWATHDCVTMDKVPYIGKLAPSTPNIYVATGYRKWGMTSSVVSALIIKDLVIKGSHEWLPLYDPNRINLKASAGKFVKENLDVAVNFISGKLSLGSINDELKPNEGKVIRGEGQRIGAYKDANGDLHLVDNTCTHMGCELSWNDAETTWDCPCHGSRFSVDGDIVEGPTTKPLKKIKLDEKVLIEK